ncbi:hypothetical protein H4R35_007178 [Dimargaris xerosporica]|nr:hypothetical protein H4R35_007178 [Dimargaris xerosporica]
MVQNAILQKAGLRLTTKLPEDATCGEMAHWHPLLLFNQESNSINVQRGIDAMIKLVETLPDAEFTIPESLPDVKMVGALKQIQPDIQLQQAVINILGEDAPALILAGLRQYTKELQERLGSTQNKQLLHAVSPNTAWLVAEPSETLGLE